MQTIESLNIKNLAEAPQFLAIWWLSLLFFLFSAYFGFYVSFLCNSEFLFLFPVEVGFLTYTRIYKPPKEETWLLFKENKLVNLWLAFAAPFTHKKKLCVFCLIVVFSFHQH